MSFARCALSAGIATLLAVSSTCSAQSPGPSLPSNSGFNNPYSNGNFNGGFSSYGSGLGSSPTRYTRSGYGSGSYGRGGSYSSGMAGVIRAQGQANLLNSQALNNYQQARSRYIDNQVKWQQAYHVMRRSAESFWEQDRQTRAAVRDRWLASRGSGAPVHLTAAELNPQSGQIRWPDALQLPAFAQARGRIEDLMEARARSTASVGTAQELHKSLKELCHELRAEIHHIPPHEYMQARKFIDSLTFESTGSPHES